MMEEFEVFTWMTLTNETLCCCPALAATDFMTAGSAVSLPGHCLPSKTVRQFHKIRSACNKRVFSEITSNSYHSLVYSFLYISHLRTQVMIHPSLCNST